MGMDHEAVQVGERMAKKPADLSRFQVNVETPQADKTPSTPRKGKTAAPAVATPLVTKGFRVKPEAARQFDMLKAEVSGNGKDKGPALIAEALNLLFKKYGKSLVA
jgi:hypothetical protein